MFETSGGGAHSCPALGDSGKVNAVAWLWAWVQNEKAEAALGRVGGLDSTYVERVVWKGCLGREVGKSMVCGL